MSEYIVEMYDECEKYSSEYGCKPTNTHGFPLREEIVRCRDCAFREVHDGNEYPIGERGSVYCLAWSDGMQGKWTKLEGFCHKAKLREGVE